MIELNTIDSNIVEELGSDILTLEQLVAKSGYEVSGHFKRIISSLRKKGILSNKRPGYFVQSKYKQLINELKH